MCLESRYYRDDVTHSNSRIAICYHTVVLGRSTVDSTKTPPRISVKKPLVSNEGMCEECKAKTLTKLDSSGDAKLNSKTFTLTVSVPINRKKEEVRKSYYEKVHNF